MVAALALGNYCLERSLGSGPSATVYLARDTRDGHWVALKVMSHLGSDEGAERSEQRHRFVHEATTIRRLQHPDIVTVQDAGETAGASWLAMDLAPGHPLERYTHPQHLLPVAVAVRIAERVARALAHTHAQGVVHRDLKPSNVLVDLPTDSLKLTDFGTARLLDTRRTGTEFMLGTPVYMAPELLIGNVATAATDLYALGVLLFELLTGQRPYASSSMGELLRLVVNAMAPDVRLLRPELPAALAEAVARMLRKSPADRPSSGDAAADELKAVRATLPASPTAPTQGQAPLPY
jgi:serine/threonine-protein kinase